MISKELISELRRIVGERNVSVSRAASELYSYDGSLAKGAPGAVVFPADTRECGNYLFPWSFGTLTVTDFENDSPVIPNHSYPVTATV